MALIVTLVALAYLFILAREDVPSSAPAPLPAPVAMAARLSEISGLVEVRQKGGDWKAVDRGAPIDPGADLRTAQGASAALAWGDGVRVQLEPNSQLQLAGAEPEALRFVVGEGLFFADVSGGKRVQFQSKNGQAVAETTDGALYLAGNDKGELQAAVERGEATLTANGATVVLKPGFVSIAKSGERPTAPTELPRTLLLKMRWPEGATSKARQRVVGEATPGARLRIGDQIIWVADSGKVDAIVELKEGDNHLAAELVDVAGRRSGSQSGNVRLDTRAPTQAVETSPDMWNKRP